jgi:hypothetical protein
MTNLMNRRDALGALAGASAALLTASTVALPARPDTLSTLIATHREKREAYERALDELEAAWPPADARVKCLAGDSYALRDGKDKIRWAITGRFGSLVENLKLFAEIAPNLGAEALPALERERDAALARLDEAFARKEAADERVDEATMAEEDAILAICECRCSSFADLEQKFGYLTTYRDELSDGQREALFASLADVGEA